MFSSRWEFYFFDWSLINLIESNFIGGHLHALLHVSFQSLVSMVSVFSLFNSEFQIDEQLLYSPKFENILLSDDLCKVF